MPAVSDTSPLSCLASIERLDLLKSQFGLVYVPPAVRMEALRHPSHKGREAIKKAFAEGILIEDIKTELLPLVSLLNRTLDKGESEAISLAVNSRAEILLVDEREGREVARGLGIRVTGTLGILMRAKLDGSLNSLRNTLEELRSVYAFSLDPKLVSRALKQVGEE